MTSMIERVARAIATMNDGYDDAWSFYKSDARAVIEAMREPTDKMIASVDEYAVDHGYYSHEDPRPEVVWPVMIEAALAEDK